MNSGSGSSDDADESESGDSDLESEPGIRKKKIPIHAAATFGALGALIDEAVAKFRG